MIRSLAGRFFLTGSLATVAVVVVLGFAVMALFARHAERELLDSLDADLRFLGRSLVLDSGGMGLSVEPLPDPRFQEPFSGLYWQVRSDQTGAILRSPSLGGYELPLEMDDLRPGELHRHLVPGPGGAEIILLERRVAEAPAAASAYRIAVAVDRKVLERTQSAFLLDLVQWLSAIAVGLALAMAIQAATALRPIASARRALRDVHAGRRARLSGALPAELDGLAAEFDALLEAQRRGARIARERAADMAHGLRTPLALLGARVRDLRARGEADVAAEIELVAASIEARLARELARAHIHGPGSGTQRVRVAPVAERIAGALSRIPSGEKLAWTTQVPDSLELLVDETDLVELLGALLENAANWAQTRVILRAEETPEGATILVEDDGPGIPPHQRRAALMRGMRLDPARSGTGLGLAIAQDIADAYSGALALEDSHLGGLAVRITLPRAADQGAVS